MKIITYLFILLVIFTIPLFSFVGYIAHAIPPLDSESIYESSAIIVVDKTILITYDTFNHTPIEKKIDFGMTMKNIHGSYANGYEQMIIPILLLVIISIISVIYYKKTQK